MLYLFHLLIAIVALTPLYGEDQVTESIDTKSVDKDQKTESVETKNVDKEEKEELILTPQTDWKSHSPSLYRMSPAATKGVKGKTIPYTFWFDHFTWDQAAPLNEHAEHSFQLHDGHAYAIIVTSDKQFDINHLGDIVIKNAKESGFGEATIVSSEKRIVNDEEILFLHWKALLQGINVDFLSYVFSGGEGSIFIHTYTPAFLFKNNFQSMETFLNGLVIDKSDKGGIKR